ncbi:MAG: hypothetical protein IMZ75_08010, partial [Actinobacteria bacterium]|nr:hypothetical protein [Actinomycetota bacterium]
EVKLGKNGELSEAVAEQLEHYVRHIRDEAAEAYARCYEKTYAQKRRLGLIAGAGMPDEIEIDGREVEGLVVVGGHTQEAMAQAQRLRASPTASARAPAGSRGQDARQARGGQLLD